MPTPEVGIKHGRNNIYKLWHKKALIRRNNIKKSGWVEGDKTNGVLIM
jgi:hypothetical protein